MTIRTTRYCLILALFSLWAVFAQAGESLLRVTFLDVGQGDAIILRTATKNIIIDAGDDRADAARRVIIPFCKKEGIKHFDHAVVSHAHRDHFGGFIDLLEAVSIGEVLYGVDELDTIDPENPTKAGSEALLYKKFYDSLIEKNIPYTQVKITDTWNWGAGIKVKLLHVPEKRTSSSSETDPLKINQNECSLAFKVIAGKVSYLFTGDLEKKGEATVIENFRNELKCTVYKSGHHGSNTSSTYPFMDLVKPEYSVISVGEKNSFGHPTPETLEKYAYYGIKVFRTDQDGTVDSYTDGKTVRFISNQSALEFTKKPKLISLTPTSATLQWETNKPATTGIAYGLTGFSKKKEIDHAVTVHTITMTGLKPATKYIFEAKSVDARQPDQIVTESSSLTTPAGSEVPLPGISTVGANYKEIYMKKPFKVHAYVKNPGDQPAKSLKLMVFHSSMSKENLIGEQAIASLGAGGEEGYAFDTEFSWLGKVELICVLMMGKEIIDTASFEIEVLPKLIIVDAGHGNIDYFIGKFAGMKMDVYQKLGFTMKSASSLTATALKDAFVLIIPDPSKDFTAAELAAVKGFVGKGGSVLLFQRADYKNYSKPEFSNKILAAIGSGIRFNDDEFCDPTNNIGSHWRAWVTTFPSPIVKGVSKLLVRSSCTLLNSKMQGLKAGKDLHILAAGDNDCYNIEADGKGDGYIYASHTPLLPLPLVACEDLGTGRVACYGERLYDDGLYSNTSSDIQTPAFNRSVLYWLSLGKEKTLKEILQYVSTMDGVDDVETRFNRFENVRGLAMEKVKEMLDAGEAPESIQALFQEYDGDMVEELDREAGNILRFEAMHSDR